ncbi:MAG: hypothetical protein IPP40_13815 [bacterium]|nr:hypothetical protein [bacterium]
MVCFCEADDQRGNVFLKMADGTIKLFSRATLKDWVFYQPEVKDERVQSEIACALSSSAVGVHDANISYEAAGFQWDARYRLLLNDDSTGILEGWASVPNRSGKKFEDADLVLVEGRLGRYRNLSLDNRLDGGQVANIIAKQPGFKVDPDGDLHVRGGRDTEAKYNVDGQASGEVLYNSSKRMINTSALNVENVDILTGGDASTGGYQSSMVKVRTPESEAGGYPSALIGTNSADARTYSSELISISRFIRYPIRRFCRTAQTEVVLLDASKV